MRYHAESAARGLQPSNGSLTANNEMLENTISGLIIAAVGALTVLAYKHPAGYIRLAKGLLLIGIVLYLLASGYACGFTDGKYSDDGEMFFSHGWLVAGLLAAYAYFFVLTMLPHILKDGSDSSSEEKDDS